MNFFENETMNFLYTAMLVIIPIGAAVRVGLCAIAAMTDEDKVAESKRRGKNAIYFAVFAELITVIVGVLFNYYQ